MTKRLEEDAGPTLAQVVVFVDLTPVHNRHKAIGGEKQQRSLERWRSHADHGEGMLVYEHHTAHDATIGLEMAVPITVGQDHIRRAVGTTFIVSVEEAAQIGLNSQYVEVVPARLITPDAGGIRTRVQNRLGNGESCQIVETAVA